MSTTLSTHPPQPAVTHIATGEQFVPRPTTRPNLVDKLALRLGLWLITYSRRRFTPTREQLVLWHENDRAREQREADWQTTRWSLVR